jgi:hypothetical protein
MKHQDLPQRWKDRLKQWLISQGEIGRETLCAHDFYSNTVAKLTFEDESYAEFKYPLVIEAPELNEIGLFTEHCGYHIFSLGGTRVVIESTLR